MTSLREFRFEDLFKLNRIMFDPMTEVYALSYITAKVFEFPNLGETLVAPNDQIMGFILGSCAYYDESLNTGKKTMWDISHGHVCALSISSDYRRLGLGSLLMQSLSDKMNFPSDFYMDLYVRSKNQGAIQLYTSLGYFIYKNLPCLYIDDHGYEMRKRYSYRIRNKSNLVIANGKNYLGIPKLTQQFLDKILKPLIGFKNILRNNYISNAISSLF